VSGIKCHVRSDRVSFGCPNRKSRILLHGINTHNDDDKDRFRSPRPVYLCTIALRSSSITLKPSETILWIVGKT